MLKELPHEGYLGKNNTISGNDTRETNDVLMRSQYQAKYELRLVCLSVCMERLGSHWKDFHET